MSSSAALGLLCAGPTLVAASPRLPRPEQAHGVAPSATALVAAGVAAVAALVLSEALHDPSSAPEAPCSTDGGSGRRQRVRHPRREALPPLPEAAWPFGLSPHHEDEDEPETFAPRGWAERQKLAYMRLHYVDTPARAYSTDVWRASGGSRAHAERAGQAQRARCLGVVHDALLYQRVEGHEAIWIHAALAHVTRSVRTVWTVRGRALAHACAELHDQHLRAVELATGQPCPVDIDTFVGPPVEETPADEAGEPSADEWDGPSDGYDPYDSGGWDSG
jgi:hypothetical protein